MLDYNPLTGECVWKPRPRHHFNSDSGHINTNRRNAGKVVGYRGMSKDGRKGYAMTIVNGRLVLVHRLLWVLLHGQDPGRMRIDHINGDPWDNRAANLRLATSAQNTMNKPSNRTNTSGYKGVIREGLRWRAKIGVDGKTVHLGAFDSPEEAHRAYCEAAAKYHGEFANTATRSPRP